MNIPPSREKLLQAALRPCCTMLLSALFLAALMLPALPSSALDFARIEAAWQARFPSTDKRVLERLRDLLQKTADESEDDRLERVNDFFNRAVRFDDDQKIWGEEDYWATPLETLAVGGGDCEDIAIGKYYTLLAAGVPVGKLRLVYVRATINTRSGPAQQAHMVLAYYPSPTAEPLILDNLDGRIHPASRRGDLRPVYSFNSEAVWVGAAAAARRDTSTGQMTRWQDLQLRNRSEGFE
jgi:predicted transglutaminase-like cysteine proteinase